MGDIARVRELIQQYAAVDKENALMWPALGGHLEVLSYITEQCGADVNTKRENGNTALNKYAATRDKMEVIRYFTEHGVDVNTKNKKWIHSLMGAAQYGNT